MENQPAGGEPAGWRTSQVENQPAGGSSKFENQPAGWSTIQVKNQPGGEPASRWRIDPTVGDARGRSGYHSRGQIRDSMEEGGQDGRRGVWTVGWPEVGSG